MLDDLDTMVREFDLQTLLHPHSVEHFMINLVIVGLMLGVLIVVWKALSRLWS